MPLAALGYALQRAHVLDALEVALPIKTISHQPSDKLVEALVLILAGGRSTSHVDLLLRPNSALALASLLFPGFQHSLSTLQPTVLLAEQLLHQRPHQQARTVWRLDAGFGSDSAINWLLARDYQLLPKGYNSRRAQKVVSQVAPETWQVIRPNKWVAVAPDSVRYARRTQTLASARQSFAG